MTGPQIVALVACTLNIVSAGLTAWMAHLDGNDWARTWALNAVFFTAFCAFWVVR